MISQCADCLAFHLDADLDEAQDLAERLTPGDEVPAGECPDCGALSYIVREPKDQTALPTYALEVARCVLNSPNAEGSDATAVCELITKALGCAK